MTSLLDTEAAPVEEPSARATITPRDAWSKAKLPIALGVAFVVVALLQAIVSGGASIARLDPEANGPDGGLALATLLREHGVDVRRVETPSGSPDTTVFIPVPELVELTGSSAFADARAARDLVVVGPDDTMLETMRIDAGAADTVDDDVREPGCEHPDASAAGDVLIGGVTFGAPESAVVCYADRGDATFVELVASGRRVTLLGSGSFMTNLHLDDHGDAALALRLLTRNPTVEWVYPRLVDLPAQEPRSLTELLPHRLLVATAQVCVAILLLALWRARRLGPVVVEPLPVVVRAAEAVEGRARLYETARALDQAGNALRAGLRDRLVRVLGLAPDADPQTMVAAVSARTGREATAVIDLLYGPPPADDAALVRLAADLDQLDTEVRAL